MSVIQRVRSYFKRHWDVAVWLSAIAFVFQVAFFIAERWDDERDDEANATFQAWQLVSAATNRHANYGQISALSWLAENQPLRGVNLAGSYLEGVDLTGAWLDDARFSGASLLRANFANARIGNTFFDNACMEGAVLTGVNHRGRMTVAKQPWFSVRYHNEHARDALRPATIVRLDDAYKMRFVGARLNNAKFIGADLMLFDFTNADLSQARFDDADLTKATLTDANIAGAQFMTPDGNHVAQITQDVLDQACVTGKAPLLPEGLRAPTRECPIETTRPRACPGREQAD